MLSQFKPRPRVLVVEDEFLLALNLEQLITELGFEVVGPVASLQDAARCADKETLDAAILDIQLQSGERVYPIADILLWRHIPHMFMSARGHDAIEPAYAEIPLLSKPLQLVDLRLGLRRLLASAADGAGGPHDG
ncbi:response regulator [Inquilinus sp. NPDC058860]|uniref:response regulator n=1 Tax=Inquilinus sp. NPDC058860 TaxID=3346652 RepID=UPI00368A8F88